MDITIRTARRDELPETVNVYLECVRDDYTFKPEAFRSGRDPQAELDECVAWLDRPGAGNCILAAMTPEGHMAGYIAVGPNVGDPPDYDGEVTGFFVRSAYRRQGVGARLLREGVRYLQRAGLCRVVIYNMHVAASNGYYRRLGGQVILQVTQTVEGMPLLVDVFGWETADLLATLERRLEQAG